MGIKVARWISAQRVKDEIRAIGDADLRQGDDFIAERRIDLAVDKFDNGRTPDQLERSFQNSYAVAIAWLDGRSSGRHVFSQIKSATRIWLMCGPCRAFADWESHDR